MWVVWVALLTAAVIAGWVYFLRDQRWAAQQRADGNITWRTRNLGLRNPAVRSSKAVMVSTAVGLPLAGALFVLSFVVSGRASLGFLGLAVVIVLGLYAIRLRA
jgi:hypothetical protein